MNSAKNQVNLNAFYTLVKAGLWEKNVQLLQYKGIDFYDILRIAEEQAVVGLVAAGINNIVDVKPHQEILLQFVGESLQLEQQNTAMNLFIGKLMEKMRVAGIYTLLVKGQGIAQCYEKPLWRACGDVDFLLSDDNYNKAKAFLSPIAISVEPENKIEKHLGLTIDSWVVELHGTMHGYLSHKIDKVVDEARKDVFYGGSVRSWFNGKYQVFLPSADSDVIFVFTHFLKHFYKGGLGVKQICDWCRLLWTYKDAIKKDLLEKRIKKMGVMSEWNAFGAFAVEYLGMPSEAMPFYSDDEKWKRKADMISSFVIEVGNMGHNRESSYYNAPYLIRKINSMGRRIGDLIRHARIFPLDSLLFLPTILIKGIKSAAKGE